MTPTHYETLGVPKEATLEAIKKARNQKIRLRPPEQYPEEFKGVELAFKILSDPVARAVYDAQLAHGPELEKLETEASELWKNEDWAKAARIYKKMVVLNPKSRGDWNMLGICQTQAGNWAEAKKAYERLVREVNDSPLYWSNYASVFLNEAVELPVDSPGRVPLLAEARKRLEKARAISPKDPEVYGAISRTYSLAQDYTRAIEWLEKQIAVEGAPPVAETYYLLAQMTNLSGNRDGVMTVADRLVRSLPNEPEARSDAGRTFARSAIELFESHLFGPALIYMKAAARISPQEETIRKVLTGWLQAQEASDQYDLMSKDPVVIPPIRLWLAILSDEVRNLELDQPRDQLFDQINEAIKTYDDPEIVAAARQVRVKYPALYRLNPAEVDKFERPRDPPQATGQVAAASSSSCFVVTATFGGPQEPVVEQYRRFRDESLSRHPAGRVMIRIYGRVGPVMALIIRRCPALRRGSAVVLGRLARHLPGHPDPFPN